MGRGWYDEWLRRLATNEPWVLTWLRENRHGPYWDHGSVRLGGTTAGYERIECPVLIVAGWADGYRNNSFRTVAELARHGVPHRLLAGPWAHADPTTAMPGPRIDFDAELVAWFDHWMRGRGTHDDRCDVFVRSSTRPSVDLDLHEGSWLTLPSVPPVTEATLDLTAPVSLEVIARRRHRRLDRLRRPPALGTLRRPAPRRRALAHLGDRPSAGTRRRSSGAAGPGLGDDARQRSLSVKLCDVFPDGSSALVTRGTLDLAYRDGVHGSPSPLVPGREYQVEVVLDACAYRWTPGQTLRVSVAGSDWPNTVAPPEPVSITLRTASLTLPLLEGEFPTPSFRPGEEHSSESAEGVGWSVTDDVLARVTTARTLSDSAYDTPYDGRARERYVGEVSVDRRSFAQRAEADTTFELCWPDVDVEVRSTMSLEVGAATYDVEIETWATLDGSEVSRRHWSESIPR